MKEQTNNLSYRSIKFYECMYSLFHQAKLLSETNLFLFKHISFLFKSYNEMNNQYIYMYVCIHPIM